MSEGDPDLAAVKKALQDLGEHFDSVMIFCTRHEGDDRGSARVAKGTGNWYARYGQVREWLVKEEEEARIEAKKELEGGG